jgi:hypothetical protein
MTKGRPKGSKNRVSVQSLIETFLEEAGRMLTIHDSAGPVSMSTASGVQTSCPRGRTTRSLDSTFVHGNALRPGSREEEA